MCREVEGHALVGLAKETKGGRGECCGWWGVCFGCFGKQSSG
jgi:hypothetical protein